MAYGRDQIVENLRNLLADLLKRHDIKAAYLFGSHASGTSKEYSDIDVALVLGSFKNGSPFDERFEIFHEVQQRNSLIEIVCLSEDEFNRGEAALVRHIKREGIRIL